MNKLHLPLGILASMIVANLSSTCRANAISVSFNTGATDSFNANFIHTQSNLNVGNVTSDTFGYSSTAGIADQPGGVNGGGVVAPTSTNPSLPMDATAIYAPGGTAATFNVNDGNVHTISMMIREGPGSGGTTVSKPLQIGFLAPSSTNLNLGAPFISARIFGNNQIDFQSSTGNTTGVAGTDQLVTGPVSGIQTNDWLQLIFTAQQLSPGTYGGAFSLLDYGPTGLGTPTVLLAPLSYTGLPGTTGLTNLEGSGLIAGFRVGEYDGTGTPVLSLDNFAVDAPEPASIALFAVAAMGMAGRRFYQR